MNPGLANITVSRTSLFCLSIAVLLLLVLVIVPAIFWRRKHKPETKLRYLFIGALGFLISARGLELLLHYFCLIKDSTVSRYITGHTVAYVLYGIITAGIFEECGRYIILRFFLKKGRTRENAVLYGIGHGGMEVLIITLPQVALFLIIDILISTSGMSGMLSMLHITEETLASVLPTVLTATHFNAGAAFVFILERILAMCVHISLTVTVYHGVQHNQHRYLFFAILLHMIVDTFPALYQRAAVSIIACELWMLVWAVLIALFAARQYKRSAEA